MIDEKEIDAALSLLGFRLKKAMKKWPAPNPNLICLMEEVGEIARAKLEKNEKQVIHESMDAAVCALRIFLEGA